ncbi:hypothetical protein HSB1_32720 [Halogranum salarium B-1]|uniref:Uncharacterized protein n=1 Tax=Halogranum salarium B-1 TaxID=1210908 RepID=J2ZB28_9EURY|nr:hypothetical protein HSB1_32720 [Halogranum salarium B-1]
MSLCYTATSRETALHNRTTGKGFWDRQRNNVRLLLRSGTEPV